MPTISVIIPTFNSSLTVERALNSVLNQTRLPEEVVVSDNGSTDSTLELVRRIQGDTDSIKIIITKCDQPGSGPNRNHAVKMCTGNVLSFLDSDDFWDENFLEKMTGNAIPSKCIRGAYARYSSHLGMIVGQSIRSKDDSSARDKMLTKGVMPCLLSTWVMTRDTFNELDGFDPRFFLAQDFELMHRHLTSGGHVEVMRELSISYQIHSFSETTNSHLLQRLTTIYVLRGAATTQLSLDEYLNLNSDKLVIKLQSKSDRLIRTFVLHQKTRRLARLDLLISAFILSPIRFTRKVIRQRPSTGIHTQP